MNFIYYEFKIFFFFFVFFFFFFFLVREGGARVSELFLHRIQI